MNARQVRFTRAAQREMDDAYDWYEAQLPGLGTEFLTEIDKAVRRIAAFPFSCVEVCPSVRRCLTGRFPYGVVYGLEDETIVIVAVAHLHREPHYWVEREPQSDKDAKGAR
jgi:plasmid stabilization system protein ParE